MHTFAKETAVGNVATFAEVMALEDGLNSHMDRVERNLPFTVNISLTTFDNLKGPGPLCTSSGAMSFADVADACKVFRNLQLVARAAAPVLDISLPFRVAVEICLSSAALLECL